MTLGEKIWKLRKENNITQEQLAATLGVSRQAISKWESDTTYPETDKLIRISKLFDCSLDYLLKDDIKEPEETQQVLYLGDNSENLVNKNHSNYTLNKILTSIASLAVIILVFYFGGDIINTLFSLGKEMGKSIGDVLWK